MATPLIINILQDTKKDSRGVPLMVMGRGGEYGVEDAEGPQEQPCAMTGYRTSSTLPMLALGCCICSIEHTVVAMSVTLTCADDLPAETPQP